MRTICVVTGTRADYGVLQWLLYEIREDPALRLQVVVTGMHLAPEFGLTYRAIEADGFHIDARVDSLLASNTAVGVTKAVGLGVIGFADVFATLRPDIVVVLGDRYEILAAAQAALLAGLPLAHVAGGELTEGAVDDSIRHAVSKMAQLHFVGAEVFRRRLIQMGERPDRVWTVGATGLDNIERLSLLTREALAQDLDLDLGGITFLVTYHPVTLEPQAIESSTHALLEALDGFPFATIVFTKANADAGGHIINDMIEAYVQQRERSRLVASLGQQRYLSALRVADVMIGNSSSGLIEAPAMHVPTVNIGARQTGRPRSASVIDCASTVGAISEAIQTALSPAFRATLADMTPVYGGMGASTRIKEVLKTVPLEHLVVKQFFDVPLPDQLDDIA